MSGYKHIIELEPGPERRGKATIIQTGKCKRVHMGLEWYFLAALAAGGLALCGVGVFIMAVSP